MENPKNVAHAIWSCKLAQDVWGLCSRRLQKCIIEEKPFKEVFTYLCSYMNEEELEEIVVTTQ